MYIIKIFQDGVELCYQLDGSDEYSIQHLIDVICENTKLHETKFEVTQVNVDED